MTSTRPDEGLICRVPDWPAPHRVRALVTTRRGGCSQPPFDSLNLGDHVGDDPAAVAANRARLQALLPAPAQWLSQVHGIRVLSAPVPGCPEADAVVTSRVDQPIVVMTADCLPVLLTDRAGTRVAAAHAGWRGLCDGVLEQTVAAFDPGAELMAWLGPAIGPAAFEVGEPVRAAFAARDAAALSAFRPVPGKLGHWWADLYALARQRLARAGVTAVYGGGECTLTQADDYFSYRRDGRTGRMASVIWLASERDDG